MILFNPGVKLYVINRDHARFYDPNPLMCTHLTSALDLNPLRLQASRPPPLEKFAGHFSRGGGLEAWRPGGARASQGLAVADPSMEEKRIATSKRNHRATSVAAGRSKPFTLGSASVGRPWRSPRSLLHTPPHDAPLIPTTLRLLTRLSTRSRVCAGAIWTKVKRRHDRRKPPQRAAATASCHCPCVRAA